jgi:hypothetical protein
MNKKPKADDFRMKATEFDNLMRNALGAPPLPVRKKPAKKTKAKKARPKK